MCIRDSPYLYHAYVELKAEDGSLAEVIPVSYTHLDVYKRQSNDTQYQLQRSRRVESGHDTKQMLQTWGKFTSKEMQAQKNTAFYHIFL